MSASTTKPTPSGQSLFSLTVDLLGMSKITESPYENGRFLRSAEIGERLFDHVKEILDPSDGTDRRQRDASRDAKDFFGYELATRLAETRYQIDASGILYGSGWNQGVIREKNCGAIPKYLLLLLLLEQRIAGVDNSNKSILASIVKELGLFNDLQTAMSGWNLTHKYPRIASCKNVSDLLSKKRTQCLKCIIFITRAWHGYTLMKQAPFQDPSLMSKIHDCLYILENNVKETSPTLEPIAHHGPSRHSVSRSSDPTSESAENVQFQQSSAKSKPESLTRGNLGYKKWFEERFSQDSKLSSNESSNYWYPVDPQEKILNPTEIEVAWLLEETIYCTRRNEINWAFLTKFASPTLKAQLVKLSSSSDKKTSDDEKKLGKLVRLDSPVVRDRFKTVRIDIRQRLLQWEVRPAMKFFVPLLRKTMHPLRLKKRRTEEEST